MDHNTVVLFSEPGKGTVLIVDPEKGQDYVVGYHSEIWYMQHFTDFHKSVEIKNDTGAVIK